jgi:hypothetical protein
MKQASPIKLILPERSPAPEDSFFLDLKEVETWVSNLPLGNTGETSKRTFKTLVELNRLEIPNIIRTKIANMLRPVVGHVVSNLRKYYFDVPIPLSAKNQKVVILCRELYMELANSYKIVVERMVTGHEEKFERKLMIVALHQALQYLFKVLYYSVIVYNPYPGNTWREIHQLYLFAEQNNIADIKIKQGSNNPGLASTIREIYLKALLLALSSPYGLRQKEIDSLFTNLPEWSKFIHIKTMHPGSEHEGQFYVDADSDNPPIHITLRNEKPSTFCHLVDISKLVIHLRAELKSIYTKHGDGSIFTKEMQITAPLLRKTIKSLTYEPTRGFNRTNLNFELDTAVGVSDIHAQITIHQTEPQESDQPQEQASTPDDSDQQRDNTEELRESSFLDSYFSADDTSIQIVPLDHPVEEAVSYQQPLGTYIEDDGAPAWTKQAQAEEGDIFSCKTQNESAGGYCINWRGDNAPKIIVGELIGIQSASDRSQFSVGIVRWLKHMPEVGLQLGFEIISPTSIAATIHINAGNRQPSISQKCLLLPKNTVANRPPSLILPIMNIQSGAEIEIEQAGIRKQVKLVRLLESTGTFSQYEIGYQE